MHIYIFVVKFKGKKLALCRCIYYLNQQSKKNEIQRNAISVRSQGRLMKEEQKRNVMFQVISNKSAIIMNMNKFNTLLKSRDFFWKTKYILPSDSK